MALLKCNACGHEVSDQAESCPNCGQPFKDKEEVVQTIQLTKKKWKKQLAWGVVFWILGFILFFYGVLGGGAGYCVLGFLTGLVGFITMFTARIGAWWSTG